MSDHLIINRRLLKDKCHLDKNGNNLFELALKKAMSIEREYFKVNVINLDGSNSHEGYLSDNQQVYIGKIGVEYHSRWCFYLYDNRKGKIFLRDFTRTKIESCKKLVEKTELDVNNWSHAILLAMINCNAWES